MIATAHIVFRLLADPFCLFALSLRPRRSIEAENLFLRRQLSLCKERGIKPGCIDAATRISLALLSRCFDWRPALVVFRPETLIRWHRAGWRLFWRYRCQSGRPRIPVELRELIRRMAKENSLWGQERIANELLVKLGIRVSPRTVAKYLPKRPPGQPRNDQRWATFFLRNHAQAILACDFLLAVTATFRSLYVFVVIHHGSRRLLHLNLTSHPTAAWTPQQLREVIGFETRYRYLIHDRDSIFAPSLDQSIGNFGLTILKSPPHSPKASAICERLIGTIRRECLDRVIPLAESHLRSTLTSWARHYNRGRPHMFLGPGVPDPPQARSWNLNQRTRHRIREHCVVRARSVLGGFTSRILSCPCRRLIEYLWRTDHLVKRVRFDEDGCGDRSS